MSTDWVLAFPDEAWDSGPVGTLELHGLDPWHSGMPNVTVVLNVREEIATLLSWQSRLALVVTSLSGPSDEVAEMYGGPEWTTIGEPAIVDSRWWYYLKYHRPA